MDKFEINLQWKQPGKNTLLTIHRIQWQKCSCCAPLRLLISEPNMNNGQKAILEISTTKEEIVSLYKLLRLYTTKEEFVSLYKLLRLYTSTHPTELDPLVQFMGNQINEIA